MMKLVPYGTPVRIGEGPDTDKTFRIAHTDDVKVVNDGAVVGDIFLSNEVIEDMADKLMNYNIDHKDDISPDDIKFIPPFPENCPIDPGQHASGPAINLEGDIKIVDVYRKADDEDIAVVPNGIIHEGEFISVAQLAGATMLGTGLCKLYKQETGKELPKFKS